MDRIETMADLEQLEKQLSGFADPEIRDVLGKVLVSWGLEGADLAHFGDGARFDARRLLLLHAVLERLYPDTGIQHRWLRTANQAMTGRTPLEVMTVEAEAGRERVYQYLLDVSFRNPNQGHRPRLGPNQASCSTQH